MKNLIIIRGLPGCGKSTYVREHFPGATPASLAPEGFSPVVVSGDHFFTNLMTGEYTFDPSRLGEAHTASTCAAIRAMKAGIEEIIVDNTSTRKWEWAVYASAADALGYNVIMVDLFDGGRTDEELATRNVHGVPATVIAGMRGKWEK